MDELKVVKEEVLFHLARFKFLSPRQFSDLGVSPSLKYLRRVLAGMIQSGKPQIKRIEFQVHPRLGKLESIYYLTEHGKQRLMQAFNLDGEDVKMPIGDSTLFYKDYSHRKNTIDFNIAVYLWTQTVGREYEIEFFDTYFDKIGNNRKDKNLRAKNRIDIDPEGKKYLIPDGVYVLDKYDEDGTEHRYLYLFEMYNGKDTKRVMRQLTKHAETIVSRNAQIKYDLDTNKVYRVICVFEFDSIKDEVIKRMKKNTRFKGGERFFLFKGFNETSVETLASGWEQFDGHRVDFV